MGLSLIRPDEPCFAKGVSGHGRVDVLVAGQPNPAVPSGTPSQIRAGDRSPRSWSKRAGIGFPGSNAGLRSASVIRPSWGRRVLARKDNRMASTPPVGLPGVVLGWL